MVRKTPGWTDRRPDQLPPPQTPAQKVLEKGFDLAFKLLYVGDESGIRDSSKNLRVLWTRAFLANSGYVARARGQGGACCTDRP